MSKPRTISDYPNRADDYETAVSKMHDQNTDIALDEGGSHEVTAEAIRDHVDSTDNPHGVTAEQVGAYTKAETGDLLDDKADQSALNATNQAVSNLDGRVDTAEDRIDGLEESKMDANNPEYTGVNGFRNSDRGTMHRINQWVLDHTTATSGYFVLLGRTNSNVAVTGVIEAAATTGTARSGVYCSFSARANSTYQGCSIVSINNPIFRPDFVTCVVDGDEYYALRFSGTNLLWYPSRWYFSGKIGQGGPVEMRVASDVSSVTEVSNDDLGVDVLGGIRTTEPITAPDFITASRVESDRQNALSALDNMKEWKKADGSIDYEKHYACVTEEITDDKGKVIEKRHGLSMEKRIAMLEKMVHELSGQIQNSKTQRK